MPRRLHIADPASFTSGNLRCEILKLLSLQPANKGMTATAIALRIRARLSKVERELRVLHSDFGLIWISDFYKEPGRLRGPAARCYAFSSGGAFCHVDVPHPVARYAESFSRPCHANAKWPETVDFIRKKMKHGVMPTYKEVQAELNVSIATIGKAKAFIRLQQHATLRGQK